VVQLRGCTRSSYVQVPQAYHLNKQIYFSDLGGDTAFNNLHTTSLAVRF
jgi:hypothetical protein